MKPSKLLYILVPVLSAIASVILVVALFFGVKGPADPVYQTLTDLQGKEVYGISVEQLIQSNYLRYAYYTPDEFVRPERGVVAGTRVDLTTQKNIAKRGTYQFVQYNLNPFNNDEWIEKTAMLAPYLQDDKSWHFAVYLPQIFSASNVYVGTSLATTMGEIENYNYIDYCEKPGITEEHQSRTKPGR